MTVSNVCPVYVTLYLRINPFWLIPIGGTKVTSIEVGLNACVVTFCGGLLGAIGNMNTDAVRLLLRTAQDEQTFCSQFKLRFDIH